MISIEKNRELVTMINIFIVKPENQKALLEMFAKETEGFIKDLPGFISATFHASEDGTRIVNYAQWRSEEDYNKMMETPEFKKKVEENEKLLESYDDNLYKIISVFEANQDGCA